MLLTVTENILKLLTYDADAPMIFASGVFWVLFLVFLPAFALIRRNRAQMIVFVVAFSAFFYYKSSGMFVVMLLFTSVLDWMLSKSIATSTVRWQRRASVALSLICSIGLLAYFKYANFFLWNWNMMVQGNFQPMDMVLPVGISFYTFQSASYIIDVYRGKVKPTDTWMEYAFFLTFFPALVAGPIVRAEYFLPQLKENRAANRTELYMGLWLVMIGVIKKAIIADYIAQYNDLIFDTPGTYSGFETLMGAIGYVMQIYCDFSGYSDMAIGIAMMMGFRLAKNFDFPYKSKNISEFWRRWHISLSTWFRDYVYIPLGGNRRGTVRMYINNLVTMLLAGLWHGAGWKFVFWGGVHGVALVVHKALRPRLDKIEDTRGIKTASWLLTMIFVTVTFIFFRTKTVADGWTMIHAIFCDFDGACILPFFKVRWLWIVMMTAIIAAHALPQRWWDAASAWYVNSRWAVKLVVFVVMIQLVIELSSQDVMPFIYFRF